MPAVPIPPIVLTAIPMYEDCNCRLQVATKCREVINGVNRHLCERCSDLIASYENMGYNGFKSHSFDHYHLKFLSGLQGKTPIHQELCWKCYIADWEITYPMGLDKPKEPKKIV